MTNQKGEEKNVAFSMLLITLGVQVKEQISALFLFCSLLTQDNFPITFFFERVWRII